MMTRTAQSSETAEGVHTITLGRGITASNVYLVRSGPSWVLVDAGWPGQTDAICSSAAALFGAASRPAAIVLTHLHPDHSGSAGELARRWDLPVHVHPEELPFAPGEYLPRYGNPLDRWIVAPIMSRLPGRARSRIRESGDLSGVVRGLDPDGTVPGLPDWTAVPTPGHTPGHVAFHRPRDGILVTGDAVLTVDLNSVTGSSSAGPGSAHHRGTRRGVGSRRPRRSPHSPPWSPGCSYPGTAGR